MTTKEMSAFQWVTIIFAEHANAKILVFVSQTKEGAELFYKALSPKGFKLDITKNNESSKYGFRLSFTNGEVMGIPGHYEMGKYPQLVWVTSGQLTHFHVGYLDENNKTQLLPHDYIFADNLLNLN
jgi:hypothetical protein